MRTFANRGVVAAWQLACRPRQRRPAIIKFPMCRHLQRQGQRRRRIQELSPKIHRARTKIRVYPTRRSTVKEELAALRFRQRAHAAARPPRNFGPAGILNSSFDLPYILPDL